MKKSSKLTIGSLKKNITNLMASYAINEYDNLIQNEMEHQPYFSIVVEDYNMGKILGKKSFISGKIRDSKWNIINYVPDNNDHFQQLEACYYSDKDNIVTSLGNNIGTITICMSDIFLNRELNKIISSTTINAIAISLILILSLFITIRLFVLKQVSNIISVISDTDEDGIPVDLVPVHGSSEIFALSKSMNNMIASIRESRIILTEQRNELKANEEQLRTLSTATEQSPVSILISSPLNIIEYVNPQFEKSSGYVSNEVVGCSIDFLFKHNDMNQTQVAEFKTALQQGKRWIGEMTPLTKSGEKYTIRLSVSPISFGDGTVMHHIYVAEDITEQKRNEELLRNSQKMDAVGQLTGGIAHDFNNLLGIIMGNLELLQMALKGQPKELERVETALAGATRGAQLTRKLLNFSRQEHKKNELTKINSFIENLRELIAKSVTAIIQVEIHLEENLWQVEIEPGDLEDAILNLALNARDAMPSGGLLVIETANKHLDKNFISQNPGAKEGDYVMVSVSDSGTGISNSLRKKIFDPFFSTKEFGKGSGLGLSMVYGFVQRSGGFINIYSEEGNGSTFNLYLPRAAGCPAEKKYEEDELPHGDETVLIVDDEAAIAETTKRHLQHLGYQTLVASNANQALEILSSTKGIDLVFSDVVMPEMDGFDLAFAAAEKQPSVKVLLTSGFSSKRLGLVNDQRQAQRMLAEKLLAKPYNLKELAFAVRRTLDEE